MGVHAGGLRVTAQHRRGWRRVLRLYCTCTAVRPSSLGPQPSSSQPCKASHDKRPSFDGPLTCIVVRRPCCLVLHRRLVSYRRLPSLPARHQALLLWSAVTLGQAPPPQWLAAYQEATRHTIEAQVPALTGPVLYLRLRLRLCSWVPTCLLPPATLLRWRVRLPSALVQPTAYSSPAPSRDTNTQAHARTRT